VPLDDVAREVVTDLVRQADARQIDLGLAAAEPAVVTGDRDALRVLMSNLVDNAVRYSPPGGRVDVSVKRGERAGEPAAIVEVTDTGPGIPVDQRERVFDRFYRVPGTTAPGSGIGLAIVRSIARQHGIRVELGAGDDSQGLRVRLLFPPSPAV
jgi:two-component system OmpR family sensor kinase